MKSFNERLALMADQARALTGGEELTIGLMQLSADVDHYLAEQNAARRGKVADAFTKWSEFMNVSIEESYRYGDQQLAIERRRLARMIASDSRWQGGYADALELLSKEAAD